VSEGVPADVLCVIPTLAAAGRIIFRMRHWPQYGLFPRAARLANTQSSALQYFVWSRHILRSAAETLSVIERQKIVRLLIKEILVGEDTITIRHSIPIPSGSPQNGGPETSHGQNYLLCKGRDNSTLGSPVRRFVKDVFFHVPRFQPLLENDSVDRDVSQKPIV
jgi:hypothetical protein